MPTWLLIVLMNGIVAILFAFFAYIWRSMEVRIKKMENASDSTTNKLIENPVLTITSHTGLCIKNTMDLKSFVDANTTQIIKQMEETEKRTNLLIENAILRSYENGKNGRRGKKR